jgi:hypothetical protein
MDLWDFTFKKLTQCVNICHIFFTDIEKLFKFNRLSIEICYFIECLRKDKLIRTILDGRNAEQARNY